MTSENSTAVATAAVATAAATGAVSTAASASTGKIMNLQLCLFFKFIAIF